jgi:hypothetical protein
MSTTPLSSTAHFWQPVTVLTKDRDGNYIMDKTTHTFKQTVYMMDTRTGDLYWNETRESLTWKCKKVIAAAPFHATFIAFRNTVRIFTDTLILAASPLYRKDLKGFATALTDTIPKAVATDVRRVVQTPFLYIAIVFQAAYGVIDDPNEARKYEAPFEYQVQGEVSYKQDVFQGKTDGSQFARIQAFMKYMVSDDHAFYLAWCFQVRGNIKDSSRFIRLQ